METGIYQYKEKEMQAEKKRASILIVDDEKINIDVLVGLLSPHYRTLTAKDGKTVLSRLERQAPPDLILLDVMMPEMDGYELCRQLKTNPKASGIPVIFVSALQGSLNMAKAFEAGGVDYITKPFHPEEVLAQVSTHLCLRKISEKE